VGLAVGGLATALHGAEAQAGRWTTHALAPWAFLGCTVALLTAYWATARHAFAEFHLSGGWACAAGVGVVFPAGLLLGHGPLALALFAALVVGAVVGFGSAEVLRRYTVRDPVAAAAHLWLLPVMAVWGLLVRFAHRRRPWAWRRFAPPRTHIPWEDL
jgi:hypothetical protein